MLGKHHLSITNGFFMPILVFGIYEAYMGHTEYFYYSLYVIVSVSIGALLPDADSGGKAKLYYDYKLVHYLMIPIYEIIVLLFNNQKIKEKLKVGYVVGKRHRGILHSPIGVLLSSLILTMIFSIVYVLTSIYLTYNVDFLIIVLVFLGLFLGQIMHLVEDSFTVSGINWLFPFGKKEIKGRIYTFEKVKGKIDIRPDLYANFYYIVGAGLLLAVFLKDAFSITITAYELIGLGIIINTIGLIGMYFASNTNMDLWLIDKNKWAKIQSANRKMMKNFGKVALKPKK